MPLSSTFVDQLRSILGPEQIDSAPAYLQHNSRDCYWYSPILKPLLDDKAAELIVRPRTVEQLVQVVALDSAQVIEGFSFGRAYEIRGPDMARFQTHSSVPDQDSVSPHPQQAHQPTVVRIALCDVAGVGSAWLIKRDAPVPASGKIRIDIGAVWVTLHRAVAEV